VSAGASCVQGIALWRTLDGDLGLMIPIGGLIGLPVVRYLLNLLTVQIACVLSRHRHPQPGHGYVIKGGWRYLENNCRPRKVPKFSRLRGNPHTRDRSRCGGDDHAQLGQRAIIYVDPDGNTTGCDNVFTRTTKFRRH
jgi:hypothetical protein